MEIKIHEGCPSVEVVIHCLEVTEEIKRMASLLQGHEQKLVGMKNGQTYLNRSTSRSWFTSNRCHFYFYTLIYD